ncbi:DNA methyltransferase [Capnocytophaga stomatis]|nr:DNA methyltransferase [Capnocytophaga stomatis]
MLPYILPLIPQHQIYVEPFFGGGAVFWAKEPAKNEIINDFNANVVNFYQVLKSDFEALKTLVEKSVVSRETYKSALVMYHSPFLFSPVKRAWAFWYATICGFSNQVQNCRFDKTGKNQRALDRRIQEFTEHYSQRLKLAQIENNDACVIIKSHDTEHTFFYCDPPYVGANQGHYGGYTQEYFNELLSSLSKVKGKFLLSSYQNDELLKNVKEFGWYQKEIALHLGTSKTAGKNRIEVLTANYEL